MNFLKRFFKPKVEQRDLGPDGWPILPGTGTTMTPTQAENLSTVFACIQAISSAISALPVFIYQRYGKERVEVESGPIFNMFKHGPNPNQSTPEFFEMLVAETLLRGNGLVDLTGGMMRVIPWHWCNAQVLPSGRLIYDVCDQPGLYASAQGKRRRLLDTEVIHVRDRSDDGLIGVSRLSRCASTMAIADQLNVTTREFLRSGLNPSAILTTVRDVSPEAKNKLRSSMTERHGGSGNAGKLLILSGGEWDLKKWSLTPEDSELLDSRRFSTEEICRVFGTPPPIIQAYQYNTFTNAQQAGKWFSQFTLLPWVRKLEAAFNRALFMDSDLELVLDMSGYDRADAASRWQAHAIAVSNGILERNEIRELEGYGPLPEEVLSQPDSKLQGDPETVEE